MVTSRGRAPREEGVRPMVVDNLRDAMDVFTEMLDDLMPGPCPARGAFPACLRAAGTSCLSRRSVQASPSASLPLLESPAANRRVKSDRFRGTVFG